jgi:hypothetical protein
LRVRGLYISQILGGGTRLEKDDEMSKFDFDLWLNSDERTARLLGFPSTHPRLYGYIDTGPSGMEFKG